MSKTAQIFEVLRKRWATAGDLQAMKLSQCPWSRLNESAHVHLKPGEAIVKRTVRSDGLQEQRIVRANESRETGHDGSESQELRPIAA